MEVWLKLRKKIEIKRANDEEKNEKKRDSKSED